MRFVIPYNEILPRRKAHDLFLFKEAAELTHAGCDVHLLIGRGSASDEQLAAHYGAKSNITLHRLPLIRKNNPLGLSWNLPFFVASQRRIEALKPKALLLSVVKQAAFHGNRRVKGVSYIYEAHEIACYPNQPPASHFALEKKMLQQMDHIIVTTESLKSLLQEAPYNIKSPIHVIPLAADLAPLPPYNGPPILTYVGQLYKQQGVEECIEAVKGEKIHLRIVGGSEKEIAQLDQKLPNVSFTGFIPPEKLPHSIWQTTAFIAPFHLTGRMPYVAHTKLYEYAAWGRPIIAPKAAIVREHLPYGVATYCNFSELKECIRNIGNFNQLPPPPSTWKERIQAICTKTAI